jgi:glycosyltransferase involved in cell wall biosynthesis
MITFSTKNLVMAFLPAMVVIFFSLKGETHSQKTDLNPPSIEKRYLCLTMIVKNESHIIERCLNSVKGIVDFISICDTGSTDNTVQIIEQFLLKNNIPGKIHHHDWKDFGHNRTLSAQAARRCLYEAGFPLVRTYLLFLDADMILEKKPDFKKEELKGSSYLVLQKTKENASYHTRLVLSFLPWISLGVTYDYWHCQFLGQGEKLFSLAIHDLEDGASRRNKFERDLNLLLNGIKAEPSNTRYQFYLAQTYKLQKRYDDAIKWFKIRLEKGEEKEELWCSKYTIGEIYEELGFWDQAFHWYLDAYQFNPDRTEPLYKIAAHYHLPVR